MIEAGDLARRLAGLEPIGLSERGTNRLAWTPEDRAARAWFGEQAAAAGLAVRRDPAGNLWAAPAAPPPWRAIGSHLDSVRDGGRFDGALGIACGFEVAARARAPVAVLAFADEEGARFNTPTFGSRALAGALDVDDVLARRDEGGTTLAEAMAADGVDPAGLGDAPGALGDLAAFVEVHIDQTRELEEAGEPAGVVTGMAARRRLRAELHGRADHAGTTRRHERRDALWAAARLVLAAGEAPGGDPDVLVTAARILVEPNALTTVAARATLWIDSRAPDAARLDEVEAALRAEAERLGGELAVESRADGSSFDPGLRAALHAAAARHGHAAPDLVSFAGHDAGILARAVPAAMVFVRNPTGVSHAPEEAVDLADAAVAAQLVLEVLDLP